MSWFLLFECGVCNCMIIMELWKYGAPFGEIVKLECVDL